MNTTQKKLLKKMKSGNKLTKEESDTLGPLTGRDLAPATGDAFVDSLLMKDHTCTDYRVYPAPHAYHPRCKSCNPTD
jgi:hypothetical protein